MPYLIFDTKPGVDDCEQHISSGLLSKYLKED